ncbi:MAG: NAD(+)/NADH kinase [Candidatus Methanomethyliaceae archaeon]|nr:NAD(+)/NADH kinase [Candidatus Methanomethyliaceae archaeon]
MISRVIITSKPNSPEAESVSSDIGAYLTSKGLTVRYFDLLSGGQLTVDKREADLVVVIGGDGTIMRTLRRVDGVPLLGIKVGALGFLCESTPEEAKPILDKILSGNYYLEFKTRLCPRYKEARFYDVMNEAVIASSRPSRILSILLSKDGTPIYRGKADGIIVSTTTGSTAYALSAGGVIIDPALDLMEVVLICPLSTGVRPFIVPISSTLEIRLLRDGSQGILVLDGDEVSPIEQEAPVIIEKSDKPACLIRVKPPDFYRRVREKTKIPLEV